MFDVVIIICELLYIIFLFIILYDYIKEKIND